MTTLSLNGIWSLSGSGAVPVPSIPATVPGNIELDLESAGLVPELFFGCNIEKLKQFEFNDWVYVRQFDLPAGFSSSADLVFEGIDCVAQIELNGVVVGRSDNAFIRHRFAVDGALKAGTNTVCVRIGSAVLAVKDIALDHVCLAQEYNYAGLQLRRPAHSYGWDISPRVILGGIWRDVMLVARPDNYLERLYLDPLPDTDRDHASLGVSFSFHTELREWDEFEIELCGRCGGSVFTHKLKRNFTSGWFCFSFPKPELWYPAGFGKQNLYEVDFIIRHRGQVLIREQRRIGIRTVRLLKNERPGEFLFRFEVNGIPVMVKGANWIPPDALHGRDAERERRCLELFRECNCNMVRVWGGGVYCPQSFYDWCDQNGVMVWQDFMMGCAVYPQDELFLDRMRREVEWVVHELRQHPSLVVWAGDNEVDQFCTSGNDGRDPNANRITREVIPQVLARLDPARPWVPSSPYLSPRAHADKRNHMNVPEQHIWGARDYFKAPFYKDNNAAFISETGFLGAPALASMKKFLSPANLWNSPESNPEWVCHATLYAFRIETMFGNIEQLFGFRPDNPGDFSDASQCCQAEAFKFFVEHMRSRKWDQSGIIWWNMIDCWPQFSDAAVDYYFTRKRSFDYIRRSQQPVQAFLDEWRDWGYDIVISNDTLSPVRGAVTVADGDSGEVLYGGEFDTAANANSRPGRVILPVGTKKLLLLTLQTEDGQTIRNHYLAGQPAFDFADYRRWSKIIDELD